MSGTGSQMKVLVREELQVAMEFLANVETSTVTMHFFNQSDIHVTLSLETVCNVIQHLQGCRDQILRAHEARLPVKTMTLSVGRNS